MHQAQAWVTRGSRPDMGLCPSFALSPPIFSASPEFLPIILVTTSQMEKVRLGDDAVVAPGQTTNQQ